MHKIRLIKYFLEVFWCIVYYFQSSIMFYIGKLIDIQLFRQYRYYNTIVLYNSKPNEKKSRDLHKYLVMLTVICFNVVLCYYFCIVTRDEEY